MATLTVTTPSFKLTSSFQACAGSAQAGAPAYYTTPNTAKTTKSFSCSSIPIGSTITKAQISFSATGSKYGGTARQNNTTSPANVSVSPGGSVSVQYTFKSNTGGAFPSSGCATRSGTVTFSNVQLYVEYTPPYTSPSVSNVKLASSSSSQYRKASATVALSWDKADGDYNAISSFTIERSANGGSYTANWQTGIAASTTSYNVTAHTTAGSYYRYRVRAIGTQSGYNSDWVESPLLYTYKAVTAPTTVTINPTSGFIGDNATLSWSGATDGVGVTISKYAIYYGSSTYVKETTSTSTTVTIPSSAGTYAYKVKTIGSVSEYDSEGYSPTASFVAINPSSNFTLDKTTLEMNGTNTITATITPADPTYKHKIEWYIDSSRTSGVSGILTGVTHTYTPPLTWATGFPNTTSGTVNCKVYTYASNGTTLLGNKIVTFVGTVPASVKPTISGFALTRNSSPSGFTAYYIAGFTKCHVNATVAGAQGSTISTISVSGGGGSGTALPWVSPVLTATGTQTMSLIVTDSRGRTATTSGNITVLAYSAPTITLNTTPNRCLSSGILNPDGTYVNVKATPTVTAIGTNKVESFKIQYRQKGTTPWLGLTNLSTTSAQAVGGGAISISFSYEFQILAVDSIGTTSTTIFTVSAAARMFDFRNDRAALGRPATDTKTFVLPSDWTTNINAAQLAGYIAGNASGNIPISNGTKNVNLNADKVDGYDTGNASGNIPISNGTKNVNLNADMVDGYHAIDLMAGNTGDAFIFFGPPTYSYGAAGSDNSVALTQCIEDAIAAGKSVLLPARSIYVNNVRVPNSCTIIGAGQNQTIIVNNSTNKPALLFEHASTTRYHARISNLRFGQKEGVIAVAGNCAILVRNFHYVQIDHVKVLSYPGPLYRGFSLEDALGFSVSDCYISNCLNTGIYITNLHSPGRDLDAIDGFLTNVLCHGNLSHGVYCYDVSGLYADKVNCWGNDIGIGITGQNNLNHTSLYHFWSNTIADTSSTYNWHIQKCKFSSFSGCWGASQKVQSGPYSGFFINGGTDQHIDSITFSGCIAINNNGHGFQISRGRRVNLVGCIARLNGVATDGAGVSLESAVDTNIGTGLFQGNKYGIWVQGGSNFNLITNNNIRGNSTTNIYNQGSNTMAVNNME